MLDTQLILVIEDDALVASCLCAILKDLNFSIIGPASSGPEALSLAELHKPDVAIVDIRLSGEMDGIDVARAFEERFGIAVIFLSGLCDEHVMARAQAVHPVSLLQKPLRASALLSAIETAHNAKIVTSKGSPAQRETQRSSELIDAGRTVGLGRRRGDNSRIPRAKAVSD